MTFENFNIDELTSGELEGNGAYDTLIKLYKAHLWQEYKKQRIRGTDYANAFVHLLQQGLDKIGDYALNKAKLPLELELLEAQVLKTGADTIFVTKQGGLVDAQTLKEMAETERIHLDMIYKLPRELALMDAQIYDTYMSAYLKEYELVNIKPVELDIKNAELLLRNKELDIRDKEVKLKEAQIDIAYKELAIKEQQLALAEFELEFKAPAEVDNIKSQTDLYNQKTITEKAQTDPSVIIDGSVISHNNKVLAEQARSYDNDGKIKVLSVLVDTWKVRRNDDPDATLADDINKLFDPTIGTAVTKSMKNVGLIT